MKKIVALIVVFHGLFLCAQMSCVYNITRINGSSNMVTPSKIVVELHVTEYLNFLHLETHFKEDDKENFMYSGEVASTLVDFSNQRVYSFNKELKVVDCYYLVGDSLINTNKKVTYEGYNCNMYTVKNKPNVKIYICQKLDEWINPGVDYKYKKSIGGIARIEIQKKDATIVYQLVRIEKTNKKLDAYITVAGDYISLPKESKSILGD